MQGNQSARGGPVERCGNRAQRMVFARASAAADFASRHRLRHSRGTYDLRLGRREVLDLSGRKYSAPQGTISSGVSSRSIEALKAETQGHDYVDAEESEVPEAAARAAQWKSVARLVAGI